MKLIETEHTAQGFVTTDLDNNQIWAFHPGAMQQSHLNTVPARSDIAIGIVAPDGRDGMIQHANQFSEAGIPFIFDPGQGLPMYDGKDLKRFVEQASWVAVNDYEWQMIQQKTGWTESDVTQLTEALIVTRGPDGSGQFIPRAARSRFPAQSPKRWSIRPGAGMRIGRGSFTAVERVGLENDGADRFPHGCDQDRGAGDAEPYVHAGGVKQRLAAAFPG